jgi:hypothetical protein
MTAERTPGTDYAGEIAKEVTCPSCKAKHVVRVPQAPSEVARTMAHAGKAADVVVRLMVRDRGPDSRPDRGSDWLRGLTDEQVRVIQGWVEANGARSEARRRGRRARARGVLMAGAGDPMTSPRCDHTLLTGLEHGVALRLEASAVLLGATRTR